MADESLAYSGHIRSRLKSGALVWQPDGQTTQAKEVRTKIRAGR
jgi:hypothetical protein